MSSLPNTTATANSSTSPSPGDVQVTIDPGVFVNVPSYTRTVIICNVHDATAGAAVVADHLAAAQHDAARSLATFTNETLAEHPTIKGWRDAFRAVGINPSKFRSSIEALLRRVARGDDLLFGKPLIDLGTAVSLRTQRPVGMHTLDDPAFSTSVALDLRFADGGETFTDFSGNIGEPDPGELVYSAGSTVLTRRWVWRQGQFGSITSTAHRLAINVDSITGEDEEAVNLCQVLLAACGATDLTTHRLDADTPQFTQSGPSV